METVFRLKTSELNTNWLKFIKLLFGKEREIEVSVFSSAVSRLNESETKKEYFTRLEKAKENVEKGKVVRFTPDEFEMFSKKLLAE